MLLYENFQLKLPTFEKRVMYFNIGYFNCFTKTDIVIVYSNISDYANVGHMKSPLLHALPFHINNSSSSLVHHTIINPIYRPLIGNVLDRVDIRLCDGNGQDIQFRNGKTMTVLKLRRRILL